MKREALKGRQAGGLLLGLAAPAVLLCAGLSWAAAALGVVAAVTVGLLLYIIVGRQTGGLGQWYLAVLGPVWGKVVLAAYLVWLALLLGAVAGKSSDCFPGENGYPWIPAVLLALVWLALRKGTAVAGRCAGVLWAALAVLTAAPLVSAGAAGDWSQLTRRFQGWMDCGALLAPGFAAVFLLPLKKGAGSTALWFGGLTAVLAVLCALATQASLGGGLQQTLPSPFDAMIRSVRLFGAAERFEAVVSAVLTVGFFLGLCLFAGAGEQVLETVLPGQRWGAAALPAAGLVCMPLAKALPANYAYWSTLLFCVLLPLLAQGIVVCKCIKKEA